MFNTSSEHNNEYTLSAKIINSASEIKEYIQKKADEKVKQYIDERDVTIKELSKSKKKKIIYSFFFILFGIIFASVLLLLVKIVIDDSCETLKRLLGISDREISDTLIRVASVSSLLFSLLATYVFCGAYKEEKNNIYQYERIIERNIDCVVDSEIKNDYEKYLTILHGLEDNTILGVHIKQDDKYPDYCTLYIDMKNKNDNVIDSVSWINCSLTPTLDTKGDGIILIDLINDKVFFDYYNSLTFTKNLLGCIPIVN